MELNIVYMYYDLLNTYGDRGNVLILKNAIEGCGINCNIKYVTTGEKFVPEECDILFMGGGQDYEQIPVGEDLVKNKNTALQRYIEDGGSGLYVCGSYQLLGKKYIAADGRQIDGTGILDIYTEKGDSRFIGDIVVDSKVLGSKLVGFENHSGKTIINNYTPLGKVLHGNGNNGGDGTEGLMYKNTICTYMHGCALSKNPEITRFLISSAVKRKYNEDMDFNREEKIYERARRDVLAFVMGV